MSTSFYRYLFILLALSNIKILASNALDQAPFPEDTPQAAPGNVVQASQPAAIAPLNIEKLTWEKSLLIGELGKYTEIILALNGAVMSAIALQYTSADTGIHITQVSITAIELLHKFFKIGYILSNDGMNFISVSKSLLNLVSLGSKGAILGISAARLSGIVITSAHFINAYLHLGSIIFSQCLPAMFSYFLNPA